METNKWEKVEIKVEDNSTCLHSDIFEINKDKSQGNNSVLVFKLQEKLNYLESDKNMPNR